MDKNKATTTQGSRRQPATTTQGSRRQPATTTQGSRRQPATTTQGSRRQPATTTQGSRRQLTTTTQGSRRQPATTTQCSRRQPATTTQGSRRQPATTTQCSRRQLATTTQGSRRQPISLQTTTQAQPAPGYIEPDGGIGGCGCILLGISYLLVILCFPFSLCLTIKIVKEYERAVIFRLGRVLSGGAKGPGMFFVLPCIDQFTKVDIRTVSYDVPPQEILTKDSVTVAVDAVIYSKIFHPTMSVCNVEDASRSTRLLAATTLRNVLGTKNMSEILSDRDSISHQMQRILDESTDPWGIKVERVEIKDVRLPRQLQRAMAAEAEAAREARAKVLAAEGEQRASRALKQAADIMTQSPAAIQLRYLQTLNSIAGEKNSTIVFPLPMDLLKGLAK